MKFTLLRVERGSCVVLRKEYERYWSCCGVRFRPSSVLTCTSALVLFIPVISPVVEVGIVALTLFSLDVGVDVELVI